MISNEALITKLVAENEISHRLNLYGHAIDYNFEEEFVDCWMEDAELFWPRSGLLNGRAAIRAAFRKHSHAPDLWHKHLVAAPLITLDGNSASVSSMFVRIDQVAAGPCITVFGRYVDRLVACPDGRWRFQTRRVESEARHPDGVPSRVMMQD